MAQATLSCRYAAIHLVYHGFYTLRGRKFPHGNFRTSVFCKVKTQIVGKTLVFRQAQGRPKASPVLYSIYNYAFAFAFSGSCASTIAQNISTQPKISRAVSA